MTGHDIQIQTAERRLLVGGRLADIGARAFDLLCVLAERPGRVVPRQELVAAVWGRSAVQDGNLAVQISSLRKLLGPQRIVTVPGRGYCLTSLADDLGAAAPQAARAPDAMRPFLSGAATSAGAGALLGREGVLRDVLERLNENGLVTLAGSGGVGKTRLAQEVSRQWTDSASATVCWADMSAGAEPGRVVKIIARSLGGETANASLDVLRQALARQRYLVVIDNAESCLAEVAQIVGTLAWEVDSVRWLVTSQAPLGVAQEQVVRVEPLVLPSRGASVEQALSCSATQLFVQRARAVDPRFAVDAANVADVVDICRRLDGLPLAIEMAVARLPLLGLHEMKRMLGARLNWLRSGLRDAPQRQRTLRATLQWSYDLLDPPKQAALRRLAVFPSGFWLDMGLDVIAGDAPEDQRWSGADSLATLVERSLVEARQGEVVRYHLLDATRAFALERLTACGEEAQARRWQAQAMSRHLRDLYLRADQGLLGFDEGKFLSELELENAQAAMAWAIEHDHELALDLMPLFNSVTSDLDAAACKAAWESTAALYEDSLPVAVRRRWAVAYAYHLMLRRAHAACRHWLDVGAILLAEAEDRADRYRLASTELLLAGRTGGDVDTALGQLMALAPTASPRQLLFLSNHIACAELERGRAGEAVPWARRAVEAARGAGSNRMLTLTLSNLAEFTLLAGCPQEAVGHAQECADLARRAGLDQQLMNIGLILCRALLRAGDLAAASAAAAEAWVYVKRFRRLPEALEALMELALSKGCLREALSLMAHAESLRTGAGTETSQDVKDAMQALHAQAVATLPAREIERARERGLQATPLDIESLVATVLAA